MIAVRHFPTTIRTKGLVLAVLLTLSLGAYAPEAVAQVTPLGTCSGAPLGAGSYVLTANLATVATCFALGADNISIDFAGFSITALPVVAPGDNGITDGGIVRSGISIVFGTIRGFDIGIDLGASTNVRIEGMRILNNTNDGIVVGSGSNISGNISNNNGGNGIQVTCPSLLIGNIAEGNAGGNVNTIGAGCKLFHNNF